MHLHSTWIGCMSIIPFDEGADMRVFISKLNRVRPHVIYLNPSHSAEGDSPSRPQYIVHPKQYILTLPWII